jgi:hypothetical protein
MGADLIGYFLHAPKNWKRILDKQADKITKMIGWIRAPESEMPEAMLEDLEKAGVDLKYGYTDIDQQLLAQSIMDDLELAQQFSFNNGGSPRDMITGEVMVGGKKVLFACAGEMSWGDEPEGQGYQELRAIWRLGIGNLLSKALKSNK